MMELVGLKFTDAEQRYFGELFSSYDTDNRGKVQGNKAAELFLAAQLPSETAHQITELCGAKRLGHFGRSQFYVALKLIAAAQAGLPLTQDVFASGVELPPPKLTRVPETGGSSLDSSSHGGTFAVPPVPGHLPPPPTKYFTSRTATSGSNAASRQGSLAAEVESSPSHQQQVFAPGTVVPPAPSAATAAATSAAGQCYDDSDLSSSPAELTPSPKITRHGKSWAAFHNSDGLLHWANFDDDHHLLGNEEDSSERHSSEDEYDIWVITSEQREYYTNQFRTMQPDLTGKITGSVAKEFFEKSKLPVHELSKIWQLSDIDKDGALSIEEFCTAMHLVVVRRNNIDLPDVLPPSLIPKIPKRSLDGTDWANVAPPDTADVSSAIGFAEAQATTTVPAQPAGSPKHSPPAEQMSPQNKEWTKFNDSPTSSVSSPSMKPVNFDFSAASVEQDPQILHPKAVRLSPDGQMISYDREKALSLADLVVDAKTVPSAAIQRPVARKPSAQGGAIPPPPHSSGSSEGSYDAPSATSSFSGTTTSNTSSSVPSSSAVPVVLPQGPKKDPPPPPPPRPRRNHARSSSLDLNRLVPPRISPSTATPKKSAFHQQQAMVTSNGGASSSDQPDFADFSHFADARPSLPGDHQYRLGAFDVYRKKSPKSGSLPCNVLPGVRNGTVPTFPATDGVSATDDSTALLADANQEADGIPDRQRHVSAPLATLAATSLISGSTGAVAPRDKPELQLAIQAHRERNLILRRLNDELNQELAEVTEERIALEIQLEHLKPFSH